MSGQGSAAHVLLRRRRVSVFCGCLCSALAASIMAVPVPYYAVFAAAALCVVIAAWIVLLNRDR